MGACLHVCSLQLRFTLASHLSPLASTRLRRFSSRPILAASIRLSSPASLPSAAVPFCAVSFALRTEPTLFSLNPTASSHNTGRAHVTTMARNAGRRQCPRDYDEPYNKLPRPRGGPALPAKPDAQGWWVDGEWIEAATEQSSTCNQRDCSSPIVIEDDDASDCYEVPPPVSRASPACRAAGTFDFNDGSLGVPWATEIHHRRKYEVSRDPRERENFANDNWSATLLRRQRR